MRMVLVRGLVLGAVGVALGTLGGITAGKVLEIRVLGVSGAGFLTIVVTAALILFVAVLHPSFPPGVRRAWIQ